MGLDAFADVFDAVVRKVETVTPLLQSDLAVAVRVAFVEEISDAVFQWLQRRDKGEELRSRHDPVLGRVHLAELPQNRDDFRVFRSSRFSVHVRKFDIQLLTLVQSFHHVGQPHRHTAWKCDEFVRFALANLFARRVVVEMVVVRQYAPVGASSLVILAKANLSVKLAFGIEGDVARRANGAARVVVLGAAVHANALRLSAVGDSTVLTFFAAEFAAGVRGIALRFLGLFLGFFADLWLFMLRCYFL